ncbi:S-adenosyl-L-methionine dependent methyltransferase [Amylostereum chailletii]|nr:S-adenosyl-L-methionine dependent methyltransferase [Amylostereum chailletii]
MHNRNPYKAPPDFLSLANAYPPLRECIVQLPGGATSIDFKNEASQRRLTEALLARDFSLKFEVPDDRLCPPVRLSLNYIFWIQDIMRTTSQDPSGSLHGIDIGTGASAIYPLLACQLSPNWSFVATDVDPHSLQYAKANVQRNGLGERIRIMDSNTHGSLLLPLAVERSTTFDFVMCNPPFYSSAEDIVRSAEAKELAPNAVCTGAAVEMITEGGETRFVSKIVQESTVTRERWYTSMLGKLSSVSEVVTLLREHQIDNYAITEFAQGKTRRWAVAWSFGDARLPDLLARIPNPSLKQFMPAHTTLREPLPGLLRPNSLSDVVTSISGVNISSTTTPMGSPAILVSAEANTWSRAARRNQASVVARASGPPLLVCRVYIIQDDEGVAAAFSWIRGRHRSAFESFCCHVGRKLRDAVRGSG